MRLCVMAFAILVMPVGVLAAAAAQEPNASPSDIARGLAAVGEKTSDEPALRTERQVRAPSEAFALGAALGAWRNAASGLTYDVGHPSGDGGEAGVLSNDCFDEQVSFRHLEEASRSARMTPEEAVNAAGLGTDKTVAAGWTARRLSPPLACR